MTISLDIVVGVCMFYSWLRGWRAQSWKFESRVSDTHRARRKYERKKKSELLVGVVVGMFGRILRSYH